MFAHLQPTLDFGPLLMQVVAPMAIPYLFAAAWVNICTSKIGTSAAGMRVGLACCAFGCVFWLAKFWNPFDSESWWWVGLPVALGFVLMRLGGRAPDSEVLYREWRRPQLIEVLAYVTLGAGLLAWANAQAERRQLQARVLSKPGVVEWQRGEIVSVNLRNAPVTDDDLLHLRELRHLQWLYLGGSHVTDDGLAALRGLDALVFLQLERTAVTGRGLVHLQALKELRNLDLQDCPIQDDGVVWLGKLAELRVLDMRGTKVTDAGLGHLRDLSGLSSLRLEETDVTDEGVRRLRKALPRCSVGNGVDLGR